MAATSREPMRFLGITSGIADGTGPKLKVATPGGFIREVPLDKPTLLRIIKSAVVALEFIEQEALREERRRRG